MPELTDIRFVITSGDVIHSFGVPALGIKCDAYPGRSGDWEPHYIYMPGCGRE